MIAPVPITRADSRSVELHDLASECKSVPQARVCGRLRWFWVAGRAAGLPARRGRRRNRSATQWH